MLLHRSQHAQVALNSPGVVIMDVGHNHLHKFLLTGKTPSIIAFPFQDAPETFHRTIVNTMCHAGHALHHSRLYELLVEYSACVLEASVTMEKRMASGVSLIARTKSTEYKGIIIRVDDDIRYNPSVI